MELTLFIDHQCNLRCAYCYNGDKFSRPMSAETMRRAVDLALRRPGDDLHVSFFGGEPLLHLDLLRETVAYVEAAVAARPAPRPSLLFVLNTNGTLLGDEALGLLGPPRRWSAYVSLDGPRELHDRYRVNAAGRGSFDAAMAGIERLRAAAVPFAVTSVFRPSTAYALGDALRAILPLGPFKVLLSPNYRDEWTEEAIADLRRGLAAAGEAWMELFRAGRALPVSPLHAKILSHLKGAMPCPSRCLLGGGELSVAPTGRLYPCAQMVGQDDDGRCVVGHVERGVDLEALVRLRQERARVEQICAPCARRDRCQSQCGCRHLALTGRLGEITAALCEIEAAFIDEADRVAETLYAEGCTAFLDYYYRRAWALAPGASVAAGRRAPEQ
ncbi:MAG: radical SAM protein [Deltaproteobacteria bacterium]|nr:radical SAM protein [Deltaproteobacteria bacterium]